MGHQTVCNSQTFIMDDDCQLLHGKTLGRVRELFCMPRIVYTI
jgi:hypothetical protein